MLPLISCMTSRQTWEGCEDCLKGKSVVLIEDDSITEWQLTKAMRRAKLHIRAATDNASQGWELVAEHQPDLVVVDLRLPIHDGLKAARCILERKWTCLVFLTDHANEAYREQARQARICGFLVKPLNGKTLIAGLEQAYTDFQQAER